MSPDPDLIARTAAEEAGDPMEIAEEVSVPTYELPPAEVTAKILNELDDETRAKVEELGRTMSPPHEKDPGGQDISLQEILRRFIYHAPDDGQAVIYQKLRAAIRDVAVQVVTHTPVSREQSLALTHLEQAMFYANAAIARRS